MKPLSQPLKGYINCVMKSQGIKNEKKRKRDVDGSIGDGMSDISELKRLKLSVGLRYVRLAYILPDEIHY